LFDSAQRHRTTVVLRVAADIHGGLHIARVISRLRSFPQPLAYTELIVSCRIAAL